MPRRPRRALRRKHRHEHPARRALGDRNALVEALLRLDDDDAGKDRPQPPAAAFEQTGGSASSSGVSTAGSTARRSRRLGVKLVSRSSSVSWPRENGRPVPNGVCSKRAQTPRRLGTTMTSRPPGASTRQISFSVSRGFSDMLQQMDQQHAVDRRIDAAAVPRRTPAPSTTARPPASSPRPCVPGMKAKTRSASVPKRSSHGSA